MIPTNSLFCDENVQKELLRDIQREADRVRLLHSIGPQDPGWLERFTCRGLACLGRWLVWAGRRLEHLGAVRPKLPQVHYR